MSQRKTLSIREKQDILKRVDEHVGSRISLAQYLGMPITTLATIIKKRESIEKSALQCGPMARNRKYIKSSKYEAMEEILKKWFSCAVSNNLPISGVLIREKALLIANELKIEGFTASNGWIDRFKKRHNVVYRSTYGKSRKYDIETMEDYDMDLESKVMPLDVVEINILDHQENSDEEFSGVSKEEKVYMDPIPTTDDAMRYIEGLRKFFMSSNSGKHFDSFRALLLIERNILDIDKSKNHSNLQDLNKK